MPPGMVGVLTTVGTAMSILASAAHGWLLWIILVDAAVAMGLAAYMALRCNPAIPSIPGPAISKKTFTCSIG
jgi:hypothetical protein